MQKMGRPIRTDMARCRSIGTAADYYGLRLIHRYEKGKLVVILIRSLGRILDIRDDFGAVGIRSSVPDKTMLEHIYLVLAGINLPS